MGEKTIWEREFKWPRSGPAHWIAIYFIMVIGVGTALWLALSLVRPTAPDLPSGNMYQVEGPRQAPDFYVDRGEAYMLRFALAHLVVFVVVSGAVGLWNAGARVPPKVD